MLLSPTSPSSGGMAAAGCAPPVTHLMAFDDTAFEELTAVCNCPQQQFSRSKPCQVSSCHASRSVNVSTSERLPLFLNDGCLARCAAGFVLPHQRLPASPQHQSQFGAQLPSSTHMMAGQEPGQSGPQPLTQMGHSPLIKQEQASAPLMNPSAPLCCSLNSTLHPSCGTHHHLDTKARAVAASAEACIGSDQCHSFRKHCSSTTLAQAHVNVLCTSLHWYCCKSRSNTAGCARMES